MIAVIDLDFAKYAAASLGEERSINVINNITGDDFSFKTRTEFYGRTKAKNTGWLAEYNKNNHTSFVAEDFTIQDVFTPKPVEHALQIAKTQVENALERLGADYYKAFIGKGESFRVERSTILKYKGNRDGLRKPIHLDAVTEYLERKFKAEIVTQIENDDACVMECYKKSDHVLVGAEKDFYGMPVLYFNADKHEEGVIDCNKFGKLWRDGKGKVRGYGRLFLYWQVCSGDDADNYAANSGCNKKWGDVSAFNILSGCTNDVEAWSCIKQIYQLLYPEPTTITGWRGDEITIDWKYVLNENFDLARMHRFKNDYCTATDVLAKLEVV